ncbi:MAG: hypothetical protein E7265_04185 [Lachnospiraceae bacterium]|nr:hypothetical protein [Lachnospiraceae bacterium]
MATTNEEFIEWLEEQAIWVKDAALTYYEMGKFTEKDIKRFATECIEEVSGIKKSIDITKLNILTRDDRSDFAIKSINNIMGVNALATGKCLEFGENGITVVYGENGAGKSGYIRILKKLADAKYKEELKENVYFEKKKKQSCEVTVLHKGKEETYNCDLSKDGEYSLLKDVDIFDTKISKAYVESSKEASYEPWVFSMLSAIAKVASDVKDEIERKKTEVKSTEIFIPEELTGIDICQTVLNVTEKTELADEFFSWGAEQENALIKKEKESNIEMVSASIESLRKEIEQLEALHKYIAQFKEFFSKANVETIQNARKQLEVAKEEQQAAKILFENTADELDKKSVSNQAWVNLWKAAKKYYNSFLKSEGVIEYTNKEGKCPLCGQSVSALHCVNRMQSIDEYINGSASERVTERRKNLIELLQKCPSAWAQEQSELAISSAGVESVSVKICETIDSIRKYSAIIHSENVEKAEIVEIGIEDVLHLIENCVKDKVNTRQKQLDLLGDEDHKRLITEIKSLRAQKYVSSIQDEVNSKIEYLKRISLYNRAEKLTATNKISKLSTTLAKELLTDDYEKRFNDELEMLTKGTVRAVIRQQKASRGKIPFKVELEGVEDKSATPSDVLSEGENRVVSLAAFFAESSGRNAKCPLIVDDPISSLDYKYEASVIRRLVEAGKKRQVIVFTHRLSMVVGLYDECGKMVPFREVELFGRGKTKGVPIDSVVNGGKSLGKLKNLKNDKIAKLKKMDEYLPEYGEGIHYLCQQIRIHVEKCIEDTLLNGVVLRYRKSIQTHGRIMWLSEITQSDCKIIDDMMTKYSYYDHSMADETPLQEFSLEEIERDVDKLITWLTEVNSRQNVK